MPNPVMSYFKQKILPPILSSVIFAAAGAGIYLTNGVKKSNAFIESHSHKHEQLDAIQQATLSRIDTNMEIMRNATVTNAANTSYLLREQGLEPIEIPQLHSSSQ